MKARAVLLAASLALLLPVSVAAKKAKPADEPFTASTGTVKLVERFVKTEIGDLPPEQIPEFVSIDPKTLPSKLRPQFQARRAELMSLKRLSDQRMRPAFRRLGKEGEKVQCEVEEGSQQYVDSLRSMGFEQISKSEEDFLMEKTKCSECELQEESSMIIVLVPGKKKDEPPTRYLFMSSSDPLFALVAVYRQGKESTTGTNFFGIGMTPFCR
ncbi:MAG: hypothetical protein WC728_12985 [Elusimicrobiota bacterium]